MVNTSYFPEAAQAFGSSRTDLDMHYKCNARRHPVRFSSEGADHFLIWVVPVPTSSLSRLSFAKS
jgi:hypothetical protein